MNGVFQRTAIFNHRFDSERKTPPPSYGFRTEHWRSACELKFQTSISIIEINSFQNSLIFLCPRAEECHSLRELRAHWCQRVVDVWRHYRVNKAIKKSAAFQFSQGLGQHLSGNVRDGTLEFVETSGPPLETEQNYWRPGVGNDS